MTASDNVKPLEETWETDGSSGRVLGAGGVLCEFYSLDTTGTDNARAKLAAQAPAMARFMLFLRDWQLARVLKRVHPNLYAELETVLRDAGVIP